MLRRSAMAAVALTAALAAPPLLANGRFPNATQLVASPADAKHFLLRTTYGVIQTFDGGSTWSWSCERAVGYSGVFDPAFVITGNGAILSGLADGLSRSTDRGCGWSRAPGLEGKYVIDLALDPKNPLRVVGVTGGERATVVESLDGGATWATISELDADVRAETLDATYSDGQRLYVSGALAGNATKGVLLRSDDAGRTFKRQLVDLRGGVAPYIAAVDRANADTLYLRINTEDLADGTIGRDHLVMTSDGGATFRDLATTVGDLLGVALSPDGSRIAYGGPRDGLWIASTTDFTFRRVGDHSARCLAWRDEGLYVCVPEGNLAFTVGLSTDIGASFRRFYTVTKVKELKCAPATATGATCPAEWPAIYSMVEDDPVIATDAGTRAEPPATIPPAQSGCSGCATSRTANAPASLLALALAALLVSRRRPANAGSVMSRKS